MNLLVPEFGLTERQLYAIAHVTGQPGDRPATRAEVENWAANVLAHRVRTAEAQYDAHLEQEATRRRRIVRRPTSRAR